MAAVSGVGKGERGGGTQACVCQDQLVIVIVFVLVSILCILSSGMGRSSAAPRRQQRLRSLACESLGHLLPCGVSRQRRRLHSPSVIVDAALLGRRVLRAEARDSLVLWQFASRWAGEWERRNKPVRIWLREVQIGTSHPPPTHRNCSPPPAPPPPPTHLQRVCGGGGGRGASLAPRRHHLPGHGQQADRHHAQQDEREVALDCGHVAKRDAGACSRGWSGDAVGGWVGGWGGRGWNTGPRACLQAGERSGLQCMCGEEGGPKGLQSPPTPTPLAPSCCAPPGARRPRLRAHPRRPRSTARRPARCRGRTGGRPWSPHPPAAAAVMREEE